MKRLHYALTFMLLTSASVVFAGWNVPVTNFAVADYSAGTQNWQLVTTDNGWLYAANNYGLLEYDGAQWRVYGMYYGNLPRSIAKLDDRAIFIGATNDIGVFTPTTKGGMHYTSFITD
ncbi:MAG: transcriptional regulator, partial [Paludibacteraceae bacterium]|nr:transcriptional regulator [Paludibacteraceae bacterium]